MVPDPFFAANSRHGPSGASHGPSGASHGDGEDDIKGGGSDGGGDLFVGGWTIHDNDPVQLAEMRGVWTSGDPYDDIVDELTDPGGLLEVGVSLFGDDDEDKLDGDKKAADLFFAELGIDELKGDQDDTVVPLP